MEGIESTVAGFSELRNPSLITVDLSLPDMSGKGLLLKIRKIDPVISEVIVREPKDFAKLATMKNYANITGEINSLILEWEPKLTSLSQEVITLRRNSQNRSIRQILGHLIDSTSNNIHRIVHLQNLPSPLVFPNYATEGNNDRWIALQDYQNEEWDNMVKLLKYSLLHLCHVIKNVDDSKLGSLWIAGPDNYVSLGEMINDFNRHLKLHLSEIDELADS